MLTSDRILDRGWPQSELASSELPINLAAPLRDWMQALDNFKEEENPV